MFVMVCFMIRRVIMVILPHQHIHILLDVLDRVIIHHLVLIVPQMVHQITLCHHLPVRS